MVFRLRNLAISLSFSLCIACLIVWVRTYFRTYALVASKPAVRLILDTDKLVLGYENDGSRNEELERFSSAPVSMSLGTTLRDDLIQRVTEDDYYSIRLFGFACSAYEGPLFADGRYRWRVIGIPYWFLALLTAIPPALWLRRHHRASLAGRCPTCNYDLRATRTRCPECGTSAPPKDAATSVADASPRS